MILLSHKPKRITPPVHDINLFELTPERKIQTYYQITYDSKGLVKYVLRLYTTIKTYSNIYIHGSV